MLMKMEKRGFAMKRRILPLLAACMLLLTCLMQYMKRRQKKADEELDND